MKINIYSATTKVPKDKTVREFLLQNLRDRALSRKAYN